MLVVGCQLDPSCSCEPANQQFHGRGGCQPHQQTRKHQRLPEDLRPKATTDDLPLFQPKATSKPPPSLVLLDGKPMKKLGHPHRAIVQGDGTSLSIAMASILAKTLRDQLMLKLDEDFPQYGFVKHKGYGTPQHLEALRHHGPCPHHRPRFLRNLDI